MKFLVLILVSVVLSACTSQPPAVPREPDSAKPKRVTYDLGQLQTQLGMDRSERVLGFVEREFDSCLLGVKGEGGHCGARHFNVVNFRILCRDSEDTVSEAPTKFLPLANSHLQWKVAGASGIGKIDQDGYAQLHVVSEGPLSGQRLVLIVGKQFLGLEVSEVNQIIVPIYWCRP